MPLLDYYPSSWSASLDDQMFCHAAVVGTPPLAPKWIAQTITPGAAGTATYLVLPVARYGTIADAVTVHINMYGVDVNGKPTGPSLAHSSATAGELHNGYLSQTYAHLSHQFDFDAPMVCDADTTYAIVMSLSDYTAAGVAWGGLSPGTYPNDGQTWESDDGTTWISNVNTLGDAAFQMGYTVILSKPTTPAPVNDATGVDFTGFELSWEDGGGGTAYTVYIGETGALTQVSWLQPGLTYTTTLAELQAIFGVTPIDQKIYWRVDVTDGIDTVTGDEWNFDARPAKATTPGPADAAIGVNLNQGFTWAASAATYAVYSAVSGNPLESLGDPTDELAWTPDPWSYGLTFQWRVDATNVFGTTTGDVWSFTALVFDPPMPSWELIPGGSGSGPADDPPGVLGTDFRWTGINNMVMTRRLVAAANNKVWYENI